MVSPYSESFLAWRMVMEAHEADIRSAHRRNEAHMRSLLDPVNDLSEAEFKRRYRLSKDAFLFLCDTLRTYTDLRSSQRVSFEFKILSALSFYATGSYQRSVGEGKHLSQESMSNYIEEVTSALNHPRITKEFIQFPTTDAARERIKRKFYAKYGIPGVIGCIDGCHFRIFSPKKELEHMYYCRKIFYSLNVQMDITTIFSMMAYRACEEHGLLSVTFRSSRWIYPQENVPVAMKVCDCDCRIMAVNAKFGGATHDAFIWDLSTIHDYMQTLHQHDSSCWLLGDSGYPLRPWMMTPCNGAVPGSAEAHYTTIHGQARVIIENTFGRLKNRWRCCIGDRVLHYTPEKCGQIITACSILHNIALDFGVPEPDEAPPVVEVFRRNEVAEVRHQSELLQGHAVRNHIIRHLMQP